jgi:uncharacterized membrane protein YphA (DoxX/SURF4 family)
MRDCRHAPMDCDLPSVRVKARARRRNRLPLALAALPVLVAPFLLLTPLAPLSVAAAAAGMMALSAVLAHNPWPIL